MKQNLTSLEVFNSLASTYKISSKPLSQGHIQGGRETGSSSPLLTLLFSYLILFLNTIFTISVFRCNWNFHNGLQRVGHFTFHQLATDIRTTHCPHNYLNANYDFHPINFKMHAMTDFALYFPFKFLSPFGKEK